MWCIIIGMAKMNYNRPQFREQRERQREYSARVNASMTEKQQKFLVSLSEDPYIPHHWRKRIKVILKGKPTKTKATEVIDICVSHKSRIQSKNIQPYHKE